MRIIDADAYYESLKDTLDVWGGDEAEDVLIRNAHRAWIKKLNNAPTIKTKQIKYFDEEEKVWKTGEVIVDREREGECIECYYEPKDKPQTDCAWK